MRNYDKQKRILVTGGAGFLGSHLIDRLLAQGHEVVCADNLFTGSKRNIAHLHDNPAFEFMRHDVTFPLYLEVDQIYNLACPASPIHYQHDPVQTTKTSVHGAINMLGLAKRLRCRIFQASTSEVYGDPSVHPQPESYWGNVNPIGLRCSSTTTASMAWTSRSRASSTPMVRACTPTTGVSFPISSCRRCATSRSRSMAMAARRGLSAMSMT
jgi:nucleoside-diphosphate-sugar epimerase